YDDRSRFAGRQPGEVQGAAVAPYERVRLKINKAREKFREYKGECCSLALFNERAGLVTIDSPVIVLGAMLGDITYCTPIDLETGQKVGPSAWTFGNRGKMNVSQSGVALNTTISAVI